MDEVIKAQHEVTREWLKALFQLMTMTPGPEELTFWKTTVEVAGERGDGTYLLTLQHVSGEKAKLSRSARAAEDKP